MRSKFLLGAHAATPSKDKDQVSRKAPSSLSGTYRGLSANGHFARNSRLKASPSGAARDASSGSTRISSRALPDLKAKSRIQPSQTKGGQPPATATSPQEATSSDVRSTPGNGPQPANSGTEEHPDSTKSRGRGRQLQGGLPLLAGSAAAGAGDELAKEDGATDHYLLALANGSKELDLPRPQSAEEPVAARSERVQAQGQSSSVFEAIKGIFPASLGGFGAGLLASDELKEPLNNKKLDNMKSSAKSES